MLNPDCLLIRFGEKAKLAFSDSWAIFILQGVFRGHIPMARGTPAGLLHFDLPADFYEVVFSALCGLVG